MLGGYHYLKLTSKEFTNPIEKHVHQIQDYVPQSAKKKIRWHQRICFFNSLDQGPNQSKPDRLSSRIRRKI